MSLLLKRWWGALVLALALVVAESRFKIGFLAGQLFSVAVTFAVSRGHGEIAWLLSGAIIALWLYPAKPTTT